MANTAQKIVKSSDGKYCWFYEFKLLKNPTILMLIMKVIFWSIVGIWLFINILNLCNGHFTRDFLKVGKVMLILLAGMEVLTLIGYFVYAAILGFKYCVVFEMDEAGVKHTQMPSQFKRSQAVSLMETVVGLTLGKPGLAGAGLLSATKQSMYSAWTDVNRVKVIPERNVIKVDGKLNHNQVYVEDADFQFVADFVRHNVGPKCKISEVARRQKA